MQNSAQMVQVVSVACTRWVETPKAASALIMLSSSWRLRAPVGSQVSKKAGWESCGSHSPGVPCQIEQRSGAKASDMVSGTRRVMGINFQVVGTALLGKVA